MQQPGEPSVEEILDSIKKVIARDNRDGALLERRKRAAPAEKATEPAASGETEEVFELPEETALDEGDSGEDALTRGDTREAMRQNFAALAMLAEPGKQPQIVRSGETSLEDLVREMLRPMIKEWLDANLATIVEQKVEAEVERISRMAR